MWSVGKGHSEYRLLFFFFLHVYYVFNRGYVNLLIVREVFMVENIFLLEKVSILFTHFLTFPNISFFLISSNILIQISVSLWYYTQSLPFCPYAVHICTLVSSGWNDYLHISSYLELIWRLWWRWSWWTWRWWRWRRWWYANMDVRS